jgi:hypothetical protein
MKKIIFYCLCSIFILNSCTNAKEKTSEEETSKPVIKNNGFVLKGSFNEYLTDEVYLNKIIEQSLYPIDSAIVKNNKFTFQGIVTYPERFAITFQNYSEAVILIIENTAFEIEINATDLQEPIIIGSPLNNELTNYKIASKNIFNKIQYLFPHFQKARLENDSEKLLKIGEDFKNIENEHAHFTYQFIEQNSNSYVAVMLLRDQLKKIPIDTLRIENTYKLLSEKVKHTQDAEIITTTLNLH